MSSHCEVMNVAFEENKATLKGSGRRRFQRNPLTSPKEHSPESGCLGNLYVVNHGGNNLVLLAEVLKINSP